MKAAVVVLVAILVGLLSIATLLPMFHYNVWWIRGMVFPKLQLQLLMVCGGLGLVSTALAVGQPRMWFATVVCVAVGAYHVVELSPYRPASTKAMRCADERRFVVMVANVQLENDEKTRLVEQVRRTSPDVLLALETDDAWIRALDEVRDLLPHTAHEVTGSHFGMAVYTRLDLSDVVFQREAGHDVPMLDATLTLRNQESIRFLGVHPRPPHPGQSARGRDAQLLYAALQAADTDRPVVVAGDFNAVPWEDVFERMQRIGGLLDPRQRFGFTATFKAGSWWSRWPLDHVLHTRELTATRTTVHPANGSDHHAYSVAFCLSRAESAPPSLRPDDHRVARQTIAEAVANTE